MQQGVFVEGCGDAQRIVISGFQRLAVLDQINAQQQAARTTLRRVGNALQELQCLRGRKVAKTGAGVEEHPVPALHFIGQCQAGGKVCTHADDVECREAVLNLRCSVTQEVHRNIDGNILARFEVRY